MKTRKSVQIVENAQLKENLPEFNQGDTVLVQVIVKEGSRERTQPFEGVVIGRKNRGLNLSLFSRSGLSNKIRHLEDQVDYLHQ